MTKVDIATTCEIDPTEKAICLHRRHYLAGSTTDERNSAEHYLSVNLEKYAMDNQFQL